MSPFTLERYSNPGNLGAQRHVLVAFMPSLRQLICLPVAQIVCDADSKVTTKRFPGGRPIPSIRRFIPVNVLVGGLE